MPSILSTSPSSSYWQVESPPSPIKPSALDKTTDILIVGGGYSGLSAALVCAKAGHAVTVVDADQIANGASVRNAGMFGAHPKLPYAVVAKTYGEKTAQSLLQEAQTAYQFTKNLINNNHINCQLQLCGRVQGASTIAHFKNQQRLAQELKQYTDIQVKVLQQADLREEINTQSYIGGLLFPEHGGLHPQQFHSGLVQLAIKHGVNLHPQTPVQAINQYGNGFTAITSKGDIQAKKVIITANGYLQGKFSWLAKRVFPLPSFIAVTAPRPPEFWQQLFPRQRMVVETRAKHCYYRLTPDGTRLLLGARASLRPINLTLAAKRLHTCIADIFPSLSDLSIDYCWTGNTGYTFSHLPNIGVTNGMHYAMGYSGSGVVMAPYLGMKVAHQALGDERGQTAFTKTQLQSRPFYFGGKKPAFLFLADWYYNKIVDIKENIAHKKDTQ